MTACTPIKSRVAKYVVCPSRPRDWIGNGVLLIGSGSFNASIPPCNDTSPDGIRDDNPAPNGVIYDLNGPGLGIPIVPQPQSQIRRTRNNFKTIASITIDGTPIRCSPIREYFVRFSMIQTTAPSGNNWAPLKPVDIRGDNQAGYGRTLLTWDLK